jgi:hypothetical protein
VKNIIAHRERIQNGLGCEWREGEQAKVAARKIAEEHKKVDWREPGKLRECGLFGGAIERYYLLAFGRRKNMS